MGDITFSGLATGMDTNSIVSQLMEVERLPIDRIEDQKAAEKEKLDAYAQFKTIIDDLKDAASAMTLTSDVRTTEVDLDSGAAYTATSNSAQVGSYEISVAQLAQVQKNVSDGWSSNTEALFGTGTLTVNGEVINVTESNNSMLTLVAAINDKSETTGVNATIINDGSDTAPYHIIFTGTDSSTSFTVTSDLKEADNTPITFSTTQTQSSQQAIAYIDGIEIVSDTNTISNAISGVTLRLDSVSETSATSPTGYVSDQLRISADTDTLKEKLTTFVSTYNKAIEWILSGYEELGGTTTTIAADGTEEELLGSVLRGDASISSIKRGLQNVLSTTVDTSGSLSVLSQLGITTTRNGTLRQDNTILDAALENNYDDTVYLLSGKDDVDGVMKDFNYYLLDVTSTSTGLYASKKTDYDQLIERLDDDIAQMEPRMAKKEATLRSQFLAMELLVSGLNAQGDFLTQQMDMLSNMLTGKS